MKVYIVFHYESVKGVFTSQEKADSYIANMVCSFKLNGIWDVKEKTLDFANYPYGHSKLI
jgi:hypothetical protein